MHTFKLPGQPCPNCGKGELLLEEAVEEDITFGDLLLSVVRCESCGYKNSDITFLRERTPIAIRIKVRSLRDLKSKVARSGSATIRIPELGIRITPGQAAEGYVSNVEGVLERVETVLQAILPTLSGKHEKKAAAVLKDLRKARDGKKRLTIELKDPSGNSAIMAMDQGSVKERRLTKRELDVLMRYGRYH
jgi:zinc finger protein